MRIGAHVPTRGRPASAIDAARAIGADTLQLFVSNPRGWAPPSISAEAAREFAARRTEVRFGPVYAHASYLVNIASPDPAFRRRSVELARQELDAVAAIGGDGLVVHTGAGGGTDRAEVLDRAAASVLEIAGSDGGPPFVVLELTAGGTGSVASTLPEAAALLDAVGRHPRVALCLDTCHLFAAGYPLDDPAGAAATFADLRRLRLTRRLRVVHANDARDPRGSRRDRHAHVGQGHIGERGFRAVLDDPAVRRAAVVIEVPGTPEEHRRDLDTLRRLAGV